MVTAHSAELHLLPAQFPRQLLPGVTVLSSALPCVIVIVINVFIIFVIFVSLSAATRGHIHSILLSSPTSNPRIIMEFFNPKFIFGVKLNIIAPLLSTWCATSSCKFKRNAKAGGLTSTCMAKARPPNEVAGEGFCHQMRQQGGFCFHTSGCICSQVCVQARRKWGKGGSFDWSHCLLFWKIKAPRI